MDFLIIGLCAIILILLTIILVRILKNSDSKLILEIENIMRPLMKDISTEIITEQRAFRLEIDNKIDRLKETLQSSINDFLQNNSAIFEKMRQNIEQRLNDTLDNQNKRSNELKDSLFNSFTDFNKIQQDNFVEFSKSNVDSLDKIRTNVDDKLNKVIVTQSEKISELTKNNTESMDKIRNKLDERLDKIQKELENSLGNLQASNEKKLDEMRNVVNEKLEKTLETRLQKSFDTVTNQLESVNKSFGEMKNVAESVGSLNRMLTNTKSRGILGELQLGQIIEDMLAPQQYEKEVSTVPGTSNRVEFAIKLPNGPDGKPLYLPIDSKFPLEDYDRMLDGYEQGDKTLIDVSRKALYARIRTFARDINSKYVAPPYTTPFAILFLPTEGLYAEIVRDAGFFNSIRREGVIIAGPSTFSVLLSSLLIGFDTLQIQKSAASIEKTLGAVKKEFDSFDKILKKAHEKITQAGNDIDSLVGTRTRAINRSLREVKTYEGEDSQKLLGIEPESAPINNQSTISDLFEDDV